MDIASVIPDPVLWGSIFVASLVALRFPVVGIGIYLWFDFIRITDFDPDLRAFRPMLCVGVALLAGSLWQVRRDLLDGWMRFLPLGALLAAAGVSALFAEDSSTAGRVLVELVKLSALIWAIARVVQTRAQWEALIGVIALSLGVIAVYAIVQGVQIEMMKHPFDYARVIEGPPGNHDGPFRDSNDLARILCLALPLWWWLATAAPSIGRRALGWTGVAVTVVAIEYTFSRGGFVAMLVAVAIAAQSYRPRWRGGAFVVVFAGTLLLVSPGPYTDRMLTIANPMQESAFTDRLEIWESEAQEIRERPLQGHGPGALKERSVKSAGEGKEKQKPSHNVYVELLSDLGVVGLGAYLWLMGAQALRLRRVAGAGHRDRDDWAHRAAVAVGAALAAFLVASILLGAPYSSPPYMLVAFALALERIAAAPPTAAAE